jgi:hypothetical protein
MDEVGRVVRIRCAVFLSGLPSDRKSVTKLCAFVSAAEQRFSRRLLLRQGAWGNRATVGGAAHQFAGRLLATIGVGFGVAPPSATVEFLHDDLKVNEFPWAGFPHKVGLHDSCSAVRGLGHARPSELSYEPYFASGISRTRRKNMNPRDIILAKLQESTFRRPPEKRLIWTRSLSCVAGGRPCVRKYIPTLAARHSPGGRPTNRFSMHSFNWLSVVLCIRIPHAREQFARGSGRACPARIKI